MKKLIDDNFKNFKFYIENSVKDKRKEKIREIIKRKNGVINN
jgi:hypothetical protein